LLWVLLALLLLMPADALARRFETGFFDPAMNTGRRTAVIDDVRAAGADIVRHQLHWEWIAPVERPVDFQPSNPGDPRYRWALADAVVKEASVRGLRVMLTLGYAPSWAEGANRPSDAFPGSWRPDAQQVQEFAVALARRYSGTYPDPAVVGAVLPRVRLWQAWNEPNLSRYLAPQWIQKGRGWRAESPRLYRRILNAFYRGTKSVSPDNVVVSAGTAPYGDPAPGGRRIMPVRFMRELLCVSPSGKGRSCSTRSYFDVLAHHPYGIRGPGSPSLNADDAAVPDLGKLKRVLREALRHGVVLPRKPKRLWVTEVSWDSSPPDPDGVPEGTHARWVSEALYRIWRQAFDTVIWFRVRDELPVPDFSSTYQSGAFFVDGRPKLAAQAFRFPFVADRSGKKLLLWGRAPADGQVVIQRKSGANWVDVTRFNASRHSVFARRINTRKGTYRAIQAGISTLETTARKLS
jgi:hypothetical protein